MAGRKTMAGQMTWWPRRAIIYRNSGPVRLKEREGEVAWRALPLIRLPLATPPIMHNGRLWAVSRGRRGSRGDETVAGIFFFPPLFERCSVSS